MVYKWYILPIGGLYATYHLLGEPETTIEYTLRQANIAGSKMDPFEDVFSIDNGDIPASYVSLREGRDYDKPL